MKRNTHFVVPQSAFRLLSGSEELTEYRFNTKVAVHMFCRICGVQPFYRPRSNPDGVAITAACITSPTVASITVKSFDGQNWEGFIEGSGIRALSKPVGEDVGRAGAATTAASGSVPSE